MDYNYITDVNKILDGSVNISEIKSFNEYNNIHDEKVNLDIKNESLDIVLDFLQKNISNTVIYGSSSLYFLFLEKKASPQILKDIELEKIKDIDVFTVDFNIVKELLYQLQKKLSDVKIISYNKFTHYGSNSSTYRIYVENNNIADITIVSHEYFEILNNSTNRKLVTYNNKNYTLQFINEYLISMFMMNMIFRRDYYKWILNAKRYFYFNKLIFRKYFNDNFLSLFDTKNFDFVNSKKYITRNNRKYDNQKQILSKNNIINLLKNIDKKDLFLKDYKIYDFIDENKNTNNSNMHFLISLNTYEENKLALSRFYSLFDNYKLNIYEINVEIVNIKIIFIKSDDYTIYLYLQDTDSCISIFNNKYLHPEFVKFILLVAKNNIYDKTNNFSLLEIYKNIINIDIGNQNLLCKEKVDNITGDTKIVYLNKKYSNILNLGKKTNNHWGIGVEHETEFYRTPIIMNSKLVGRMINQKSDYNFFIDLFNNYVSMNVKVYENIDFHRYLIYMYHKNYYKQLVYNENKNLKTIHVMEKFNDNKISENNDIKYFELQDKKYVANILKEVENLFKSNSIVHEMSNTIGRNCDSHTEYSFLKYTKGNNCNLEFVTKKYNNTTVEDCVNELLYIENKMLEFIKLFYKNAIYSPYSSYPFVKYYSYSSFNYDNDFIEYNKGSSFHINITLPLLINNDIKHVMESKTSLYNHLVYARLLQFLSPVILACYGTPDFRSIYNNNKTFYTKMSYRILNTKYVSLCSSSLKKNFSNDRFVNITPENSWLNNIVKKNIYNNYALINNFTKTNDENLNIGSDFRSSTESRSNNFGFEFRILDGFDTKYLKDILLFISYLADFSHLLIMNENTIKKKYNSFNYFLEPSMLWLSHKIFTEDFCMKEIISNLVIHGSEFSEYESSYIFFYVEVIKNIFIEFSYDIELLTMNEKIFFINKLDNSLKTPFNILNIVNDVLFNILSKNVNLRTYSNFLVSDFKKPVLHNLNAIYLDEFRKMTDVKSEEKKLFPINSLSHVSLDGSMRIRILTDNICDFYILEKYFVQYAKELYDKKEFVRDDKFFISIHFIYFIFYKYENLLNSNIYNSIILNLDQLNILKQKIIDQCTDLLYLLNIHYILHNSNIELDALKNSNFVNLSINLIDYYSKDKKKYDKHIKSYAYLDKSLNNDYVEIKHPTYDQLHYDFEKIIHQNTNIYASKLDNINTVNENFRKTILNQSGGFCNTKKDYYLLKK